MSAEAARSPIQRNLDEARSEQVESILRREAPKLLAHLIARVDEPADAADLLGDVLLVVWRRIDTLPKDDQEARMWIYGIARKVLSTHRRGRARRIALTSKLQANALVNRESTASRSALDPGQPDSKMEAVGIALSRLSSSDRDIIGLVHWDGFTLVEAAKVLRIRHGTARSRYQRARRRLKAQLEADL